VTILMGVGVFRYTLPAPGKFKGYTLYVVRAPKSKPPQNS
jgi:hypothetical protein